MLSEDEITRGLEELAVAQGRKIGDERWRLTLKVYWRSCRWMSPEQWRQAIAQSLERDDRFPTVRKLREYAGAADAARPVPRCSYCGEHPVSIRDVCSRCAAAEPGRAGLEQREGSDPAFDAALAEVRRSPIRPGEGWLSYLHRTAVGAGLMPSGAPGLLGQVAMPATPSREPGEEG